jgi:hypothetical protein
MVDSDKQYMIDCGSRNVRKLKGREVKEAPYSRRKTVVSASNSLTGMMTLQ